MAMFVNPDNSAFQVALNSEIYVDKTGMLEYTNKVMNTLQGYICNSRPRRFGKSVTANMLAAYYSKGCDSREMFSTLKISESIGFKKNINKYDVIHLDIQWCIEPAGGSENVVSYITEKTICELREYYPNELSEKIKSLPEALSVINSMNGTKFIIIIDEWDIIIRDEANNKKVQEEYINFLRAMFKGVEPTKYIGIAYLTGILPIKKLKTQLALNNFKQYTMLTPGPLAEYIGFTEEEVKKLCDRYGQDFYKVKRWYDGYKLGRYHIYNPNAVVSLMIEGEFRSYWSETGSYRIIVPLINMDFDGLKSAVIEMLAGGSVEIDVTSFQNDTVNFEDKDDILTYLIHLGYLAYNQKREMAFVPNEEIREELFRAIKKKKWNEFIEFQQKSLELLEATLELDSVRVAAEIEEIHTNYASAIQYNDENSLSSVLSIAYLGAMQYYFKPVRELPTGKGFADFIFIPKPEHINNYPAIVVELKWDKKAETAIKQIKDKNYPDVVKQYTGDILLVGISYEKKQSNMNVLLRNIE